MIDDIVASLWEKVVDNTSDFFLVAFLPSLASFSVFYSLNIFYLFVHFFPNLSPIEKWKIQPTRREKNQKVFWMLANALFNHFTGLVLAYTSYDFNKYMGMKSDVSSLPRWYVIIFQVILCCFLYDFFFYIFHRVMHIKFLFQKFHYVHHSSNVSMGITQSYFHPVDFWLSALATLLPAFVATNHILTWSLWNIVLMVESVNAHSGYRLPLMPDATIHDYHHSQPHKPANFGAFFGVWDKLLGTDKPYQDWMNEKNNNDVKKH